MEINLTSKQRAKLRSLANSLDTILQVGKQGVVENVITQAEEALPGRELIKGRTLETCPQTPREAAELIASRTGAVVVQVIGSRFVLYRPNPENPQIQL